MKKLAVLLCGLLAGVSLMAETAAPAKPADKTDSKAPTATEAKKPAAAAKTKADEKKKEEEPKIPGTVISRANGTFLGLEVVGGNFKLSFYDKKKKAVAPDVTRAVARWPNVRGPGDNRTVLNLSGTALVGSKPVVPPFTFNVYLTLLQGEGDAAQAVETYTVPFRG